AAEPALVHVGHAHAGGLFGDGFLSLLLGADEQHGSTVSDGLLDELACLVDVRQGLLQVDDVDAVAVGEDEPRHLRIPATGLVSDVAAAVEQLPLSHSMHACFSLSCRSPRWTFRAPRCRPPVSRTLAG